MHGSRARGLLAAALTALALAAAVRAFRAAPDPDLVARWWPATVLLTIVHLLSSRRDSRNLTLLTTVGLFLAGLTGGRGSLFSVGFAIANTVEVLLVVWWLTRFTEGVPPLRSWGDFRRWLLGLLVASSACATITAATLWVTDGVDPWRTLVFTTITHLGAQAVGLSVVMRRAPHRVRVSVLEVLLHLALLAVGGAACIAAADGREPVAFLLLPVMMWGAARFRHRWASLELLVVTGGIIWLSVTDRGPFGDVTSHSSLLGIAASAQAFVAVGAITAVAFAVATSHLRDSLDRIRDHETRLGQLLDSASGTAFIATDLDGTITWFSPGAEELLGWTEAEVVGRTTPMLFHDVAEAATRARELGVLATSYDVVTAPLEQGSPQDTRDWTYVRRDGSRVTVSLSVTAVRDDEGRAQSHLSVARDVSARRAAEQALVFALDKEREANRRLHDLDRAKGDFVSSVSHELRTPLTSIMGYTEILGEGLSGELSGTQQDLVEKIDRNGARLLRLVEDLLTLSRVEKGSFQLESHPTDLREAIAESTRNAAEAARDRHVAMTVTLPPLPVTVLGDRPSLERLVTNLVSNAVKFTEPGGSVNVSLESDRSSAVLTVADTGIGIPLEEQDNLFQRFFRSSYANERAIQGTGLGLSIVRSIASAHEGRIEVDSVPGVGTTFRFVVPLQPTDVAPVIPLPTPETTGNDAQVRLFVPRAQG